MKRVLIFLAGFVTGGLTLGWFLGLDGMPPHLDDVDAEYDGHYYSILADAERIAHKA